MDLQDLQARVDEARQLINDAEVLAVTFAEAGRKGTLDEVTDQVETITDKLEEAQQILLETEAAGLPDQEIPGEAEAEAEAEASEEEMEGTAEYTDSAAYEEAPFDFMVAKQDLEHRSRLIEADVYRKAADLVGEPLTEPRKPSEEQDQLLNTAATALEAGLGSKPDPETLVKLLELRVLQLEIKKARYVAELLLKIDPEGEFGAKATEWLQRFDSDPKLKDRGKCFIATASCGAEDHPDVLTLQRFRDEVLLGHPGGRSLVDAYYRISPPIARAIEHRPTLQSLVRTLVVHPAAKLVERRRR